MIAKLRPDCMQWKWLGFGLALQVEEFNRHKHKKILAGLQLALQSCDPLGQNCLAACQKTIMET